MDLGTFTEVRELARTKYSSSSRYNFSYHVTDDTYTFMPSYPVSSLPETENEIWHTVLSGQEGKLDLISYQYYNTPDFWWAIAQANKIVNPLRVTAGLRIRIPALTSLPNRTL